MKYVVILAVIGTLTTEMAGAQQADPACQVANALFGAIFKGQGNVPCSRSSENIPPPAAAQPDQSVGPSSAITSGGPLDTPENLATVMSNIRTRYGKLDLMKHHVIASDEFCRDEMKPFYGYRDYLHSGYRELQAKCFEQEKPIRLEFEERNRAALAQAKESQAAADAMEKRKDAEEVALLIAQLRSGKRVPINCPQYMVTKGFDNPEALMAPVMTVAYKPPSGPGRFLGRVEQIDSGTIVLSGNIPSFLRLALNPPDNFILLTDKSTKVFKGEGIQAGGIVQGFAEQVGTRSVKLVSGRSSTVAVMRAVCLSP